MLTDLLKSPFCNGEGSGSDPESVSGTGAPPKVNQLLKSVDPIITPRFNEIS